MKKKVMQKRTNRKKKFKDDHRKTTKGRSVPLSHRSDGY